MFDLASVVQILAGENAIGSGYRLSNGRVLTAAHVVGERDEVAVRSLASEEPQPMRVAWKGAEAWEDFAVLAPLGDLQPAEDPAIQLHEGEARGHAWEARGFPGVLASKSVPAEGRIFRVSDTRLFELVVTAPPPQVEDWLGMSGTAIFIEYRLWAVLRSVPKYFDGKVIKVCALELHREDRRELRAALGLPPLDGRHAAAVKEIARFLAGKRALIGVLVSACPQWEAIDAASLAREIVRIDDPLALIKVLQDAIAPLDGSRPQDRNTAHELGDLLDQALAAVAHTYADLGALPDEPSWRTSSVEMPPALEPRMAWEQGRRVEWRDGSGPRVPRGYVEIDVTKRPEAGANGEEHGADIALSVDDRMEMCLDRWFAAEQDHAYSGKRLDVKLAGARAKLNNLRAKKAPRKPIQPYAIVGRECDLARERPFLRHLTTSQRLQQLQIVVASGVFSPSEVEIREALLRFHRIYDDITSEDS